MAKQTKSDQSKKLRAIFFNSCEPQANDNFERIPRAFNEIGWEVIVEPHESLKLENHQLMAGTHSVEEFDLIWPIGFGEKDNFLLYTLAPSNFNILPITSSLFIIMKSLCISAGMCLFPICHAKTNNLFFLLNFK